MSGCYAAFDVGGTKTALLLADRRANRLGLLRESTSPETPEAVSYRDGRAHLGVARHMVSLLRSALLEADCPSLLGIGIGAAGPVDGRDMRNPPNVGATGEDRPDRPGPLYVPLVDPLREAFGAPILLRNDCRAAVLGEVFFGVGRAVPDKDGLFLAYVTLSTGFGAGVWDGGHLVTGKDGNAGEVGHLLVREGGLPCGCGNRGCAEAYCSGSGIVRNARARLQEANASDDARYGVVLRQLALEEACAAGVVSADDGGGLARYVTPRRVFEAAEAGDPLAVAVIDEAVRAAGIAFAGIANACDPDVVSVGGGVALAHPELLPRIDAEMRRHLNVRPPHVQLTSLGEDAVLYGALVLAQQAAEGRVGPSVGS